MCSQPQPRQTPTPTPLQPPLPPHLMRRTHLFMALPLSLFLLLDFLRPLQPPSPRTAPSFQLTLIRILSAHLTAPIPIHNLGLPPSRVRAPPPPPPEHSPLP